MSKEDYKAVTSPDGIADLLGKGATLADIEAYKLELETTDTTIAKDNRTVKDILSNDSFTTLNDLNDQKKRARLMIQGATQEDIDALELQTRQRLYLLGETDESINSLVKKDKTATTDLDVYVNGVNNYFDGVLDLDKAVKNYKKPEIKNIEVPLDQIERRYSEELLIKGNINQVKNNQDVRTVKNIGGAITQGWNDGFVGQTTSLISGEVYKPLEFSPETGLLEQTGYAIGRTVSDLSAIGVGVVALTGSVPLVAAVAISTGVVGMYNSLVSSLRNPIDDRPLVEKYATSAIEGGVQGVSTYTGAAAGMATAANVAKVAPAFLARTAAVGTEIGVSTATQAGLEGRMPTASELAVGITTAGVMATAPRIVRGIDRVKEVFDNRRTLNSMKDLAEEMRKADDPISDKVEKEVANQDNGLDEQARQLNEFMVSANVDTARNLLNIAQLTGMDPVKLQEAMQTSSQLHLLMREGSTPKILQQLEDMQIVSEVDPLIKKSTNVYEEGLTPLAVGAEGTAPKFDMLTSIVDKVVEDSLRTKPRSVKESTISQTSTPDQPSGTPQFSVLPSSPFVVKNSSTNTYLALKQFLKNDLSKESLAATWDGFVNSMVDRTHTVAKIQELVDASNNTPPTQSIIAASRAVYGASSEIRDGLVNGLPNAAGVYPEVRAVPDIFKTASGDIDSSLNMDTIALVATAKRLKWLSENTDEAGNPRLSVYPYGWDKDKVNSVLTNAKPNEVYAASKFSKLFTGVTEYLTDGHIRTVEMNKRDKFLESDYMSLSRLLPEEDTKSGIGGAAIGKPGALKGLKGESEAPIIHPLDSYFTYVAQAVRVKRINDMRRALVEVMRNAGTPLEEIPNYQFPKVSAADAKKGLERLGFSVDGKDSLSLDQAISMFSPLMAKVEDGRLVVYDKGKAKVYKFDSNPDIAKAIQGLLDVTPTYSPEYTKLIATVASFSRNVFSAGIASVPFAAQHVLRQEVLGTLHNPKIVPFYTTLQGIISKLKNDEVFRSYLKGGMATETLFGSDYEKRSPAVQEYRKLLGRVPNADKSEAIALIKARDDINWRDWNTYNPVKAFFKIMVDPIHSAIHFVDDARAVGAYKSMLPKALEEASGQVKTQLELHKKRLENFNTGVQDMFQQKLRDYVAPMVRKELESEYGIYKSPTSAVELAQKKVSRLTILVDKKQERIAAIKNEDKKAVAEEELATYKQALDGANEELAYAQEALNFSRGKARELTEQTLNSPDGKRIMADVYEQAKKDFPMLDPSFTNVERVAQDKIRQEIRSTTSDPQVAGHFVKRYVAPFVPLFRVVIGHSEQIIRSFKDHLPMAVASGVVLVTLPELVAQLSSFERDKDGNFVPEDDQENIKKFGVFKRVPAWYAINADTGNTHFRDSYMTFYTDAGPINISRPFAFGTVFGTTASQLISAANEEQTTGKALLNSYEALVKSIFHMQLLPPIVDTMRGIDSNWDSFRNQVIKTKQNEKILPEYQVNKETSELARFTGSLFDISPVEIDYAVRNLTASAGVTFTSSVDKLIERISPESYGRPSSDWVDKNLVGALHTNQRELLGGVLSGIYKQISDIEKIQATITVLEKRGQYGEAVRVRQQYPAETLMQVGGYKAAVYGIAALTNILYQMQAVPKELRDKYQIDKNMTTPEAKAALLNKLIYKNPAFFNAVGGMYRQISQLRNTLNQSEEVKYILNSVDANEIDTLVKKSWEDAAEQFLQQTQ